MWNFFIDINLRIILVLFVYGLSMGVLRKKFLQKMLSRGKNQVLVNLLNFVGTPVHELGHFVFALLFGMQIQEVCFYRTLKQAKDKRLGYVTVRQKNGGIIRYLWNTLGAFFVGIGPLLIGPLVIISLFYLMPKPIQTVMYSLKSPSRMYAAFFTFEAKDWFFFLIFLYVLIGISVNLELSRADLFMAWKGFLFLEGFFMICSICFFNLNIKIPTVMLQSISYDLLLIAGIGILGAFIGVILSFVLDIKNETFRKRF